MDFEDVKTWVSEHKSVAIAIAVLLIVAVLATCSGIVTDPDVLP